MIKNGIIFFLVTILILACHQQKEQKIKLANDEAVFSVRMLPEKGSDGAGGYAYYIVRIEKAGFKPDQKTNQYLDYGLGKDFKLVRKNDTIYPAIYQRINSGIADRFEFMLAFEKEQINYGVEEQSLVYEDKVFGMFRQTYRFNKGS